MIFLIEKGNEDPKCKTKKLDIALYFHDQKSLFLHNVSVRGILTFSVRGRKILI